MALTKEQRERIGDVIYDLIREGADPNDVIKAAVVHAAIEALQPDEDPDACVGSVVMCRGCFVDNAREAYRGAVNAIDTIARRHRAH